MVKAVKNTLLGLVGVVALALIAFWLWAVVPYTTMDEAQEALLSSASVEVIDGDDLLFVPSRSAKKGLIIYPGTRVNSEAYSVLAKALAEQGIVVAIAQMPLDLSVLDINRADRIIEQHPQVSSWSIAGHSMGGAMAAFYTKEHQTDIDGLIMLASYPSDSTDLSDSDIAFLSLYGSQDTIATESEVLAKKRLAPAGSEFYRIEGGNHAGFGFYGEQGSDGVATLTRSEQHQIIADKIFAFIEAL